FFFQAEDGIRDGHVTGVQTCALPIFPFSANFHTTSGFETFGDNQFSTAITAFPIERDQQKYQFRYDLSLTTGSHSPKFGVNVIRSEERRVGKECSYRTLRSNKN